MPDHSFVDYVLEQLAPLDLTSKPLFGGRGFYLHGNFFGFVADDRLYFRTDDHSRPDYLSQGMTAFHPPGRPRGPRTVDRNFEVPPDILEDAPTLRTWAEQAAAADR